MLDLNDISLFSAVVSNNGFSAASRALRISKSQLSKRVARLEEQLGVRLLERSTRAVRVTDVGQAFFEKCEAVLAGIAAAEAVVEQTLSEPTGEVRIACPPALAKILLARALPSFAARYPAVRVLVSALNRPVNLIEERIDVALRARSNLQSDPDLMMRVLGRSSGFLVASPGFATRPITIEDLPKLPGLSLGDRAGPDMWRLVGPDSKEVDIPVLTRIACNDFDVILSAAYAGLGVALLPEYFCVSGLRSGDLVRVLPEWTGPEVTVHLIFTTKRGLRPSVRALVDHLVAVGLNAAAGWPS